MAEKFIHKIRFMLFGHSPCLFHYDRALAASNYTNQDVATATFIPVAIANWDHTPRSKKQGNAIVGPYSQLFKQYLEQCYQPVCDYGNVEQFIFVKSGNDWAEGNYMEPDEEFGRSNLEAVRRFFDELSK